jgi:alpha-beta hydrolase superfamily lysophospholipase
MATEKRLRDDFEWFDAHRSREICAISHDGLRLFATVVKAPEGITPKGVVMLFHGFRSNARRDFCMQMKILHEAGYHLLVADQRSHSRSAGRYICYGVKERYDVITWREKAAELFGEDMPIAIMGLSMGGATVLMASELIDDADTAVKCIVADCPFSSLKGIITHVMKSRNKLPFAKLLLTFAGFWARMLAGFTLSAPSSAEIYSNSSLPALIIHGGGDDYVPINHSVDIKNHAKERVKLVEIDGARHAEAIYCDEEKYTCELIDFLDEYMS